MYIYIWGKVFKNGPSKICGRNLWSASVEHITSKFPQKALPQILLDPFLNTFPHISKA